MCINPNPEKRPTAIELLKHPLLFDYSLKYLATHQLVSSFYLSKGNRLFQKNSNF